MGASVGGFCQFCQQDSQDDFQSILTWYVNNTGKLITICWPRGRLRAPRERLTRWRSEWS
jgi:hypothetical protein